MSRHDEHAAADAPPQNPASYQDVRMAAEWASAVRDQQLNFGYDAGTGQMVLKRSGITGTLPVFTSAPATRPLVLGVEFRVAGLTLTISGARASALFWGESAVEKFLFSYYASVAGPDAPGFLEQLADAWYRYPAGVEVCAIAYLCGREPRADGTPLSIPRTVGLVCLEGRSQLCLLTLDEFTARYAPGPPRDRAEAGKAKPASFQRCTGWTVTERVSSIVAREAAEFVSGMRGHFVAFSLEDTVLVPTVYDGQEPPSELPPGTLFTALARTERPDRPRPDSVSVWVQEQGRDARLIQHRLIPPDPPGPHPDSLFWTDGSVEKLLVPYYASVKGGGSWLFTGCLMARWDGLLAPGASRDDMARYVAARLHRFGTAAERAEEPAPAGESRVFAVTHLPRSEYADDADVPGRTVFHTLENGAVSRHTLWGDQRGGAGAAR